MFNTRRLLKACILVLFLRFECLSMQQAWGSESLNSSGTESTAASSQDPINMGTGEFYFKETLLDLGGIIPLRFVIYYGSGTDSKRYPDGLTARFCSSHRSILEHQTLAGVIIIETGLGREMSFKKNGAQWTVGEEAKLRHQLVEKGSYYYCLDAEMARVLIFKKNGGTADVQTARLVCVLDRNNNRLLYEYSNNAEIPGPSKISDEQGRELRFHYELLGQNSTKWHLTRLEDQNGRTVQLAYEDKPSDHPKGMALRSITDPSGAAQIYSYNTNGTECIVRITRPRGNIPYVQEYNTSFTNRGVVASQTDALGNVTKIQALLFSPYVQEETRFSILNPDGTKKIFEHSHYGRVLKSVVDEARNRTYLGSSRGRDQIEEIRSRLGDVSKIAYHANSGKIASVTNALGKGMKCLYESQDQEFENPLQLGEKVVFRFHNLAQVARADGTIEKYSYDNRGNLTNRVDSSGYITCYEYNSAGFCTAIINHLGGKRTMAYNRDGTLTSMSDSETAQVLFFYDDNKRLKSIERADGGLISYAYDINNRLTAITNENGGIASVQYDLNGNVVKETDPAGCLSIYTYDAMDRVLSISNQWGEAFHYDYNSRGLLASLTDPDGVITRHFYDARGWPAIRQMDGQQWQTEYDREGQVIKEITPLKRETSIVRNQVGSMNTITNEIGAVFQFRHDAQNRLVEKTDPVGVKTAYTFDSRGLINAVSNSVVGQAVYQRDALGNIEQLKDPNGALWLFEYSPMGRLRSRQDPLGNRWEFFYNDLGRNSKIVFPGGAEEIRDYDPSGNLIKVRRSDTGEQLYAYDVMNRLTNTAGLSLIYDSQGHIVSTIEQSTHHGANYSASGRLRTVSYNNGQFIVKYIYNPSNGLLERVEDTLSQGWIEFTHNADFEVVQIRRSNDIRTSLDCDAAGRLVRIQEHKKGLSLPWISMNATLDLAGRIVRIEQVVPVNPFTAFVDEIRQYQLNSAGQISNTGWEYDFAGRVITSPARKLQWNSASQVINCSGVEYAWNGAGDIISRKEGNLMIHYYHNYAIANRPIVAEKDSLSGFMRFYVWSPSGQLLYYIDAKNGNKPFYYHYDRSGSTIAITDKDGALSDAYAYTPYGVIVSRIGASTQPFTYMGKWGVRQEDAQGTFYYMGARFYDAQTARFLSPDPLWPNIIEPGDLSPYQYARQDPIRFSDAAGLTPVPATSGGKGDTGLPVSSRTKVDVKHGAGSKGDYWTDYVKNDLQTKLVKNSGSYDDKSKFNIYETDPYRKKQIADERNYAGKTDKSPGGMDVSVIVTDEGNSVGVLVWDEKRKMTMQYYEVEKRKLEEGKPELPKSSDEVVRTDKSNSVAGAFVDQVSSEFEQLIGGQEQPAKALSKAGNP